MPQRDGAAIDVEALRIRVQSLQPGQRYRSEGLVDLVQINVVKSHAGALERALRRRDRFLEHDNRVTACDQESMNTGERSEMMSLQCMLADD